MASPTRSLLLVAIALPLLACADPVAPAPVPVDILPIQRLDPEPSSSYAFGRPERLIVRDPGAWPGIWDALYHQHIPKPDLLELDFSIHMVVIAALGAFGGLGPTVTIDSVYTYAPAGLAVIVRSRPCPGPLAAVVAPLDVVIVPRRDDAPRFIERVESCH